MPPVPVLAVAPPACRWRHPPTPVLRPRRSPASGHRRHGGAPTDNASVVIEGKRIALLASACGLEAMLMTSYDWRGGCLCLPAGST